MPRPQAPGSPVRLRRPSGHAARSARDPRGVRHVLPVLLATLLVALAGGANGMAAVAAFTHDHQAWFRLWLPLGAATPSRDTYLRRVRRLDPETALRAALWLLDGTSLPGLRELILALDGKVARRSGDRAAGTRALHMVSAFLVREGLTLAQEPCAAKSNEITAIPRLLDRLALKGAVVTIDAAGCQTAIVQALRAAGADYVLAVKRNQHTLHKEVKAAFDDAARGTFAPEVQDHCETVARNGGRRERRTCTVPASASGWRPPGRARPGQLDPRAGGTHRSPRPPAALRALLHLQPTGGRVGPTGPRPRPLAGALWARERPAPHPGRAVPRGRLPHAHGARPRRDGHPAPGRTEHAAHASAAFRQGCVHRPVARPHRTTALDSGQCPALNPTLRLP